MAFFIYEETSNFNNKIIILRKEIELFFDSFCNINRKRKREKKEIYIYV